MFDSSDVVASASAPSSSGLASPSGHVEDPHPSNAADAAAGIGPHVNTLFHFFYFFLASLAHSALTQDDEIDDGYGVSQRSGTLNTF